MLAAALLGRPQYLLLDEPLNGLDPNTVKWLTGFIRSLAHDHGVGILLSSHLLDEQSRACDELIIMGSGEVLAAGPLDRLVNEYRDRSVVVATTVDKSNDLAEYLRLAAWPTSRTDNQFEIHTEMVEALALGMFNAGIPITRFQTEAPSLQEVYFAVTTGHVGLRSAASAKKEHAR